jgi:hypothetical protein
MFSFSNNIWKAFSFLIILIGTLQFGNAQNSDSTKKVYHISGAAQVTNNGISFIPPSH